MNKELIDYFEGDELAANVFLKKYALKSSDENYKEQHPDQMFERLAKEIHRIESKYKNPLSYKEIYDSLKDFHKIILGGSNMFGIGNDEQLSSLANCFVVPQPEDSYGGIMKTDQELAQIMKRRGGVGTDISTLRGRKFSVTNAAISSTGSVSFAERFSNTTKEVAQDGRRGALMLTMRVSHPDILEFISSKKDRNKINGANISIKISNEFMNAVLNDGWFYLTFPEFIVDQSFDTVEEEKWYTLPDKKKFYKIKARKIFDSIVESAWDSAEPGVLFWDLITKESPADLYVKTISTNPCGEIPLSEYDSCRLLSLVVSNFVKNPFTDEAYFDFNEYIKFAKIGLRMMDDIIDLEIEKINKILHKIDSDEEPFSIKNTEFMLWMNVLNSALDLRRTGVGITGLGDAFAMLNMKYASDEAIDFAEKLFRHHNAAVYAESIDLANERGAFEAYEDFEEEKNHPFIQRTLILFQELYGKEEYRRLISLYEKYGRRNVSCLTIAPNGSLSIVGRTTSGIEPVFKAIYKRKVNIDGSEKEYIVIHPGLKKWIELNGFSYDNYDELEKLFEQSPYYESESYSINPFAKIRMQGIIQQYIDHSISVTHNLPENYTVENVKDIYVMAWQFGCKGCTIYREGSRSGILESIKKEKEFKSIDAPKRPKKLNGKIHRIKGGKIPFWVIVGFLDDKPYEIFAIRDEPIMNEENIFIGLEDGMNCEIVKAKSGVYHLITDDRIIENFTALYSTGEEVLTRLLSLSMRHYADVTFAYEQIMAVKKRTINDFSTAIAKVLSKYIDKQKLKNIECPECGNNLSFEGGCATCHNCGYSRC